MTKTFKSHLALLSLVLLFLGACEKEYSYTLPPKAPPKTSQATSTLEAAFTTAGPGTINAAYWKTANYLQVSAKDLSKNLLQPMMLNTYISWQSGMIPPWMYLIKHFSSMET